MSKKLLKKISEMTNNNVYPSLRILLEEEEDSMGGENPFDDEDEGEEKGEEKDAESEGEKEGEKEGEGEEKDAESESLKVSMQTDDIANDLATLKNKPDLDTFDKKFFPGASIVDNKNYSLENFIIIKEDATSEKLEKSLKDVDDILSNDENKEKILKLKQKANALKSGDSNFFNKIPGIVNDTISNIEHFDSLYDKASIAASDMLDIIEKQSKPEDLRDNIEEFVYQLAKSLDKQKIPHALNVKASEENSNFKNAKGGFNIG